MRQRQHNYLADLVFAIRDDLVSEHQSNELFISFVKRHLDTNTPDYHALKDFRLDNLIIATVSPHSPQYAVTLALLPYYQQDRNAVADLQKSDSEAASSARERRRQAFQAFFTHPETEQQERTKDVFVLVDHNNSSNSDNHNVDHQYRYGIAGQAHVGYLTRYGIKPSSNEKKSSFLNICRLAEV